MGSGRDHGTSVEDDDAIRVLHGRDALGDDEDAGVARFRFQRRAQSGIGRGVERRERVVEQVDGGFTDQRTGDRESLSLPPDTVVPPCDTTDSSLSGMAWTKSAAWATSSACHSSSSLASARP